MKKILLFLGLVLVINTHAATTVYLVQEGGAGDPQWRTPVDGEILVDLTVQGKLLHAWYNTVLTTPAAGSTAQVWLMEGTYIMAGAMGQKNRVEVYGGFDGTETAVGQRAKQANARPWEFDNVTTLDGNGTSWIFFASNPTNEVLDGITFRNCGLTLGAVVLAGGETVRNCVFRDNSSTRKGVALTIYNGTTPLNPCTISGCHFINNTSRLILGDINTGSGGGISILSSNTTPHLIERCVFENNYAGWKGSDIHVENSARLTVSNSLFLGSSGPVSVNIETPANVSNALNFYNNTLVNNGQTGLFMKYAGISAKFYNCAFWSDSTAFSGGNSSSTEFKHCALNMPLNGNWTQSDNLLLEDNNTGSDPSKYYPFFADPVNGNFKLTSASTLVDMGDSSLVPGVSADFFGTVRPIGENHDIGYAEYDKFKIYLIKNYGASNWSNAAAFATVVNLANGQTLGSWYNSLSSPTADSTILVWLKGGTYITDSLIQKNGVEVYGGFAGTENSISQRAKPNNAKPWEFVNETILDGNEVNTIYKPNSPSYQLFDGVSFTRGKATSYAVLLRGGETLRNCLFRDNTSTATGVAVSIWNNSAPINPCTLQGCRFTNNTAAGSSGTNGAGAGISTGTANSAPHFIDNCMFDSNYAGWKGSDINVSGDVKLTVQNSLFVGSTGGISINVETNANVPDALNFYNNTLVDNCNTGMYIINSPFAKIYNSVFWSVNTPFSSGNNPNTEIRNCAMSKGVLGLLNNAIKVSNLTIEDSNTGTDTMKSYPCFVNPALRDFRLTEASDLIDRGNQSLVPQLTKDFFANARPQGLRCDIGFYESPYTNAFNEMVEIYKRLYAYYLGNSTGDATHLDTQQTTGKWLDIIYADTSDQNWKPLVHIERLAEMARAYCDTSGYAAAQLLAGIELGLNAWFNGPPYRSHNWWYNDIGVQRRLVPLLTLLRQDLQPATLNTACNYLVIKDTPAGPATGTNLVWEAANVAVKGVLLNNNTYFTEGVNQMKSTLIPVAKGIDGIQKDNSFLFHNQQLYNGGYGQSLVQDVSLWMSLLQGSSSGFSQSDIEVVRNLILDGNQWMFRRGQYDFGTLGRSMSRKDGLLSSSIRTALVNIGSIDPDYIDEYRGMLNHIDGENDTSLIGNKMFYRADYMSQKKENYFFSVKMCSNRTNGTETMIGENTKAYWLPFGATCLMKDGEEYSSIIPLWDWSRVPGVTALNEVPTCAIVQTQSETFVGGVSNGQNGVAAMVMDKDGLTARKSWFMFDNETVCLGSGITTARTKWAITSIDQRIKRGEVKVNGVTAPQGIDVGYNGVRWVHHDSVGYVFPNPLTRRIVMSVDSSRTGNWHNINLGQPDTSFSRPMFDLRISQGFTPTDSSYSYVIVPNINLTEVEGYSTNLPVTILSNTKQIQAVTQKDQKLTGIVFYAAGEFIVDNHLTVGVDTPCVIMVDQKGSSIKCHLSDPTQTLASVNLTLKRAGDPIKTLNVQFPGGNETGSTVSDTTKVANIYLVQNWNSSTKWRSQLADSETVVTLTNGQTFSGWYNTLIPPVAGETVQIWLIKDTFMTGAMGQKNRVEVYGGFAGTETAVGQRAKPENARPWEFDNVTTLDGNGTSWIFYASDPTNEVLDGITFRNCGTTLGAAVLAGGETVRNCVFRDNSSTRNGVAVTIYDNSSPINPCTIKGCHFINNTSRVVSGNNNTGIGGGISILSSNTTPHLIERCVFENNYAGSKGSDIHVQNSARLTVSNCLFSGSSGPVSVNIETPANVSNALNFYNNTLVNNGQTGLKMINNGIIAKFYNCVFWSDSAACSGGYSSSTEFKHCALNMPLNVNWTRSDNLLLENSNTGSDSAKCYPGFVDPVNSDFKLSGASSLIDKGDSSLVPGVSDDFFGTVRPIGENHDIGYAELDENSYANNLDYEDNSTVLSGFDSNVGSQLPNKERFNVILFNRNKGILELVITNYYAVKGDFTLRNSIGQLVYKDHIRGESTVTKTSLNPGIYFLHLNMDGYDVFKKIIIKF